MRVDSPIFTLCVTALPIGDVRELGSRWPPLSRIRAKYRSDENKIVNDYLDKLEKVAKAAKDAALLKAIVQARTEVEDSPVAALETVGLAIAAGKVQRAMEAASDAAAPARQPDRELTDHQISDEALAALDKQAADAEAARRREQDEEQKRIEQAAADARAELEALREQEDEEILTTLISKLP